MEPINYLQQVADPFAQSLQGFKIGAGMADVEAKRAQAEQQRLATEKYNQALSRLSSPTATAADFENMIMISGKDQAANIKTVMDSRSAQQNQAALKLVAPIAFALKTGNVEQGITQLMQDAEAARNSGDTQEATYLTQLAEQAKTQPENIGNLFASKMVLIPGGKEALDNLLKLTQEGRAVAEAPAKLADLEAKALESGVKAEFARPVAIAELARTKAETLAPSVRESIDFANLQPEQQKTFQALQILKKPPAAVTNVNVSNVDKTAAAELGKLVPDLYNQANSAATQLSDLPRYQAALDAAITGPFAEQRLSTARVASALGFTGDKAVNATREVIQGLSEMALKSRTMLTGQGQITEGEQKLLVKARSGDINFTKGELKTIFGVADRAANAQYIQSRKLLESAAKQSPTAQMFLENMQPLVQQEVPKPAPAAQATPAAAAPGMPAGFRVIQRGQ